MPQDSFKARGSTRASKPDAGRANIYTTPVLGVVKDNFDPTRTGRLRVYISDFSGLDPDNATNWTTVRYMSNFFGSVRPTSGSSPEEYGSFLRNPSSYGEWHAPPDIGTTVICIFVNGDINYGFYIGCVPESELLHMVPAVGASLAEQNEQIKCNNESEATTYGGSIRLPTTNINTNNTAITNEANYLTQTKPVHSYTAAIMEQQGIIRDPVRGPISSSASREAASRVGWGVSTPGRPIYEGGYTDENIKDNLSANNAAGLRIIGRRGGHSIVMDDGDIEGNDQLVRIRTSKGHQILMSDDGQTLMILHSNGQSYVELGKEGTVDVYSTNSINLRTQGDLNLHADNNLNIHATKDLNIHAENMNVTTKKSLKQSVGLNWTTSALGLISAKATGALSLQATGVASLASTAVTFINGGIINLNTGKSPVSALSVDPVPLTAHPDTLFNQKTGFTTAPGKLLSITSRAPAHAPWEYAGKGVAVQTDLTAQSQMPMSPSSLVSAAVSAGLNAGVVPASIATAVSSPTINEISEQLSDSSTLGMIATTAQDAITGPYKDAITKGAEIVNTGTVNVAVAGMFTQTPEQLVNSGVLKPGADRLINSITNTGGNITQSMPSTLFTGAPGAEDLPSYVRNVQSQTEYVVTNMRQSEKTLVNAGVITGKEAPEQVAGLVYATSRNSASTVINTVTQQTTNNNVIRDIGKATSTVNISLNSAGGFGSMNQVVNALKDSPTGGNFSTNRGVVNSTYEAINQSFPNLNVNKPTDLLKSVNVQKITSDQLANVVGQRGADLVNKINPANLTSLSNVKDLVPDFSSLASGAINIPGGLPSLGSVTNFSLPNISIPGADQISNLVNNAASNALNNLPIPAIPGNLTAALGSVASIAGALSAISSIKSLFGGKGKVRTPAIASNTVNRAPIDQKTAQLLGDPKIPSPNFTND